MKATRVHKVRSLQHIFFNTPKNVLAFESAGRINVWRSQMFQQPSFVVQANPTKSFLKTHWSACLQSCAYVRMFVHLCTCMKQISHPENMDTLKYYWWTDQKIVSDLIFKDQRLKQPFKLLCYQISSYQEVFNCLQISLVLLRTHVMI